MRRRGVILLVGAALLALAVAGCGGGDDDDAGGGAAAPTPTPTPTSTAAPTTTQAPPAPASPTAESVPALVQGEAPVDFFRMNCVACHGADRAGIAGLGLPLLPEALTQPDDFYFDTIKNGRAGTVMPSWGAAGLTDPEIRAMVAFIRTAP